MSDHGFLSRACGGDPIGINFWISVTCWCCELHVRPGSRSSSPSGDVFCSSRSGLGALPFWLFLPLVILSPHTGYVHLPLQWLHAVIYWSVHWGGAIGPGSLQDCALFVRPCPLQPLCALRMRGRAGLCAQPCLAKSGDAEAAHLIGTCI